MRLVAALLYSFLRLVKGRQYRKEPQDDPPPILWKPKQIVAEIRADNVYLKIGKYLHLEQRLEEGEYGWCGAKIEIPDPWVVLDVAFEGEQLVLRVKDEGEFAIDSRNKGPLSYAILCAGKGKKVPDEELQRIWKTYAMRRQLGHEG